MSCNLDDLVRVSQALGAKVAYVQGGGGNTSFKTTDQTMYIKASGKFLVDITDDTGFLPVDWPMLQAQIQTCQTEQDYNALLSAAMLSEDTVARPSIETGFHAILDRCTLHSHSVWANLLTCAQEGEEYVNCLFPNAIWVPYKTPGLSLTKAISTRILGQKHVTVFLENHGVVVSGPNATVALAMHEAVTVTVRAAFPDIAAFDEAKLDAPTVDVGGLLVPDQAVYHSSPTLANSRAGRETMRLCAFLMDSIPNAGLTVNYIDTAERDVLLNMDSEKFRQTLVLP